MELLKFSPQILILLGINLGKIANANVNAELSVDPIFEEAERYVRMGYMDFTGINEDRCEFRYSRCEQIRAEKQLTAALNESLNFIRLEPRRRDSIVILPVQNTDFAAIKVSVDQDVDFSNCDELYVNLDEKSKHFSRHRYMMFPKNEQKLLFYVFECAEEEMLAYETLRNVKDVTVEVIEQLPRELIDTTLVNFFESKQRKARSYLKIKTPRTTNTGTGKIVKKTGTYTRPPTTKEEVTVPTTLTMPTLGSPVYPPHLRKYTLVLTN